MKTLSILLMLLVATAGNIGFAFANNEPETYQSKGTITVSLDDHKIDIKTFCVDKQGRLLVASGGTQFSYEQLEDGSYGMKEIDTPSSIHVFDSAGEPLAVWRIDVTPEALAVGPDNSVFAAGMGRIVKLDENGNVLTTVESPHMKDLPPLPKIPDENEENSEEEKAERQKRHDEIQIELDAYWKRISEIGKIVRKAKADKDEEAQASAQADQERVIQEYVVLAQEQKTLRASKRAAVIEQRNAILRAKSVKSIAVTDDFIFVCTPPPKGYGSEVWRMNHGFGEPKVIVKKLSGCCGQMNIGAVEGKLAIPENGRFKVHLHDADGNRLESWGESDSQDPKAGFGSCCNPMNITFDRAGNVLTSEASVGAVKRFKQNGDFLGQVAKSTIVPGCKHTPIGLSPDETKIYMLDLTRKQILVMEK